MKSQTKRTWFFLTIILALATLVCTCNLPINLLRMGSQSVEEPVQPIIAQDTPDDVPDQSQAPTDPPILYAASRTGLRFSTDYGKTWSPAAGDLGHVNVIALAAVKEEDRVILYAATPGGYAARTELDITPASAVGLRDSKNLVNPGVYRFTQTPGEKFYLPLFIR